MLRLHFLLIAGVEGTVVSKEKVSEKSLLPFRDGLQPPGVEKFSVGPVPDARITVPTCLVYLSRNGVGAWSFPCGHLLDFYVDLFVYRWGVELCVNRQLREACDCLVIDRCRAVEHTVELLGPSIQDLVLVGQQG